MIAFDLRVNASLVKSIVENFGLFQFTDDGKRFYSESFTQRMKLKEEKSNKRSDTGKNGMESKWGKTESSGTKRSERIKSAREKGIHTEDDYGEKNTCVWLALQEWRGDKMPGGKNILQLPGEFILSKLRKSNQK